LYSVYDGVIHYLFGEAYPSDKICTTSFRPVNGEKFATKKDGFNKNLFRLCQTATHELGHLMYFDHCMYYKCLMGGTHTPEEAD